LVADAASLRKTVRNTYCGGLTTMYWTVVPL
jgi:hypothetical protein